MKPKKPVDPQRSARGRISSKPWQNKNNRRFELIQKNSRSKLTPDETKELARLQKEIYDDVQIAYPHSPRITPGEARELEQGIDRKKV